jgi:hypothetical protein
MGEEDYTGTFVHGEMQGPGTYENDYYSYVGDFKDGRFDGHGVLTCDFVGLPSDRHKYEGMFVDGKMKGLFKITAPGAPETTKQYSGGPLGFAGPCD